MKMVKSPKILFLLVWGKSGTKFLDPGNGSPDRQKYFILYPIQPPVWQATRARDERMPLPPCTKGASERFAH